jgi:hypothetical protein
VHNAACVRKDDKILALLESYKEDEDLFASENGYHRKCYQKYTHKRLLEKLSKKPSRKAVRTSSRKKGRRGKNLEFTDLSLKTLEILKFVQNREKFYLKTCEIWFLDLHGQLFQACDATVVPPQ